MVCNTAHIFYTILCTLTLHNTQHSYKYRTLLFLHHTSPRIFWTGIIISRDPLLRNLYKSFLIWGNIKFPKYHNWHINLIIRNTRSIFLATASSQEYIVWSDSKRLWCKSLKSSYHTCVSPKKVGFRVLIRNIRSHRFLNIQFGLHLYIHVKYISGLTCYTEMITAKYTFFPSNKCYNLVWYHHCRLYIMLIIQKYLDAFILLNQYFINTEIYFHINL